MKRMRTANLIVLVAVAAAFSLAGYGAYAEITDSDETSKIETDSLTTSTATDPVHRDEMRSLRLADTAAEVVTTTAKKSWVSTIIAKAKDLYWEIVMKYHLMRGHGSKHLKEKYWQYGGAKQTRYDRYLKQYRVKRTLQKAKAELKDMFEKNVHPADAYTTIIKRKSSSRGANQLELSKMLEKYRQAWNKKTGEVVTLESIVAASRGFKKPAGKANF